MNKVRLSSLVAAAILGAYGFGVGGHAQTTNPEIRPDIKRALSATSHQGPNTRANSYRPPRSVEQKSLRPRTSNTDSARRSAQIQRSNDVLASGLIAGGTSLSKVLHTSQLSLTSTAGTDEQFVDKNDDLVADDRTTLDSTGGSFDIAVGKSGTRYEVFSATLNNTLIGVLITANDNNGDFVADLTATYDLHRDFNLPSAAAVVTGNAIDGR